MLGTIAPKKLWDTESQLLEALGAGSETLQNITDMFAPLMKHFHIFFFWEQEKTDCGYTWDYVCEHTHTPFFIPATWADPVLDRGGELGGSDPGQHGEIGDRGEPCDDVQVRRSVGRIQGCRGGVDEICPRGTGCHPAEVVSGPGEIEGAEIP